MKFSKKSQVLVELESSSQIFDSDTNSTLSIPISIRIQIHLVCSFEFRFRFGLPKNTDSNRIRIPIPIKFRIPATAEHLFTPPLPQHNNQLLFFLSLTEQVQSIGGWILLLLLYASGGWGVLLAHACIQTVLIIL